MNALKILRLPEFKENTPILCQAEDNNLYFIKKTNLSPNKIIIEYIISHLALIFGLPVPDIAILDLSEDLLKNNSFNENLNHTPPISSGYVLGSKQIPFSDELRSSHIKEIDEFIRMKSLCFDWWVRNSDRNINNLIGHPNVIWNNLNKEIFFINHSNCLDKNFNKNDFFKKHVFKDSRPMIDNSLYKKWRTKFESAIYHLDEFWNKIPKSWILNISNSSIDKKNIEKLLVKPKFDHKELIK